jgi:hypothetical protein
LATVWRFKVPTATNEECSFWDVGSQSGIKLAPLEETHHSHFKVHKYESREFLKNA